MKKIKTQPKKVILVIEDEIPLLKAVKTKLEKNNFEVIDVRSVESAFTTPLEKDKNGIFTIASVERAIKFIENLNNVDAIWLDHNLLGKEDGLDFVNKFRGNGGKWSKVPIFVVSNTSSEDMKKSYVELGVNNYYVKADYRLEEIISEIKNKLDKKP